MNRMTLLTSRMRCGISRSWRHSLWVLPAVVNSPFELTMPRHLSHSARMPTMSLLHRPLSLLENSFVHDSLVSHPHFLFLSFISTLNKSLVPQISLQTLSKLLTRNENALQFDLLL